MTQKALQIQLRRFLTGDAPSKVIADVIGCSKEEFKTYIESRLIDGMSMSNYGMWQLDHVVPAESFDLEDNDQLKLAYNFRNLIPMWKKDNKAKGACPMFALMYFSSPTDIVSSQLRAHAEEQAALFNKYL